MQIAIPKTFFTLGARHERYTYTSWHAQWNETLCDLLDILHSLRSSLGLQDEDIVYLRYMLTRVRRTDCERGHICAVWESPSTISTALDFIPRRLNRIETRLENRGLILRSFATNRKRFGNRNAAGAPVAKNLLLFEIGTK